MLSIHPYYSQRDKLWLSSHLELQPVVDLVQIVKRSVIAPGVVLQVKEGRLAFGEVKEYTKSCKWLL